MALSLNVEVIKLDAGMMIFEVVQVFSKGLHAQKTCCGLVETIKVVEEIDSVMSKMAI